MSHFACHECHTLNIDTPVGILTACEHYKHDCWCDRKPIGQCALCVARERIGAGESIADVVRDYGWDK